MQGDDTLTGGEGNDHLEGGQGNDTYFYTSGDGTDTILDTDRLGQIIYDGIILSGGKQTGEKTYQSDDGNFTYTLVALGIAPALHIKGPGGDILVKYFTSGDLNVHLTAAEPLPELTEWPATSPDWTGLRNGTTGSDYTGSADSIGPISGTPGAEVIHGLTGNDYIDGFGGADRLYGDAGNDTIYFFESDPVGHALADGGTGRDVIIGRSDGDNHFIGGPNHDPLDEGDLIVSAGGNDILEGGYGADALFDYSGADILEGGQGDDYLFGHVAVGFVDPSVPNTWSVTPVTQIIAGVQQTGTRYEFSAPDFTGLAFLDYEATFDGQGDLLLGGAGNDYLWGSPGDDYLDAGSSEDTAADSNLLFARGATTSSWAAPGATGSSATAATTSSSAPAATTCYSAMRTARRQMEETIFSTAAPARTSSTAMPATTR